MEKLFYRSWTRIIDLLKKKELNRYILVGGASVLIDFGVYYFLSTFLSITPSLSKKISFFIGASWSFYANKKFTFGNFEKSIRQPIFFAVIYLSSFAANSIAHDFVLELTSNSIISFIIATLVSTVLNYLGQKLIVFKNRS